MHHYKLQIQGWTKMVMDDVKTGSLAKNSPSEAELARCKLFAGNQ